MTGNHDSHGTKVSAGSLRLLFVVIAVALMVLVVGIYVLVDRPSVGKLTPAGANYNPSSSGLVVGQSGSWGLLQASVTARANSLPGGSEAKPMHLAYAMPAPQSRVRNGEVYAAEGVTHAGPLVSP